MARRGRPGLGVEHVENLEGDEFGKQRLKVILQTVSGELTMAEGAEVLGISQTRLSDLRRQVLQAGLDELEPGRPGRPPVETDPMAERIAELEQRVADLNLEIETQRVRTEIALAMPHLLKATPVDPGKKKQEKARAKEKAARKERARQRGLKKRR